MGQNWRDVVFLHWETDPKAASRWLPAGVRLDQHSGRTYVGLIGLRLETSLLGWLPVPYLGSFAEVNVRLYTVDDEDRRSVVFCSLDADRLVPAAAARAGYRLPYAWSRVTAEHANSTVSYAVRRRWPGSDAPRCAFSVRIGDPIPEPDELEVFLTARYGLHWSWFGTTAWSVATHPPWLLHTAELLSCQDELVSSAGLPPVSGDPVSVLWSPGVRTTLGPPTRLTRGRHR